MRWSAEMKSVKKVAPFVLTALAIVFILMGIYRGEVAVLFQKSINVCLECIGIG